LLKSIVLVVGRSKREDIIFAYFSGLCVYILLWQLMGFIIFGSKWCWLS